MTMTSSLSSHHRTVSTDWIGLILKIRLDYIRGEGDVIEFSIFHISLYLFNNKISYHITPCSDRRHADRHVRRDGESGQGQTCHHHQP